MTWDPKVVDKAINMQNLMMDIQKAQYKEEPVAVKPTIPVPVPAVVKTESSSVRQYERMNDPPATVLKFINNETKEVEGQIPSEVSLKIYKQMIQFMEKFGTA
jgi:hypothetical protein